MGVMKRVTMTVGVLAVAATTQLHAQAIITNGKVALGVNKGGALNYAGTGLRNTLNGHEATNDGCTCEGWGYGYFDGSTINFVDGQNTAATPFVPSGSVSFSSTATTATSVVTNGLLRITQYYHPSATLDLYQVDVTIENLGTAMIGGPLDDTAIRYRREMDWDIEPTAFSEYSTIHGWGATGLLQTSDNGFISSDVSNDMGSISCDFSPTHNVNFYHNGPCDHGAAFDFGFPALAGGASDSFSIFYGVADNEATALADLGLVSADDIYSLAQGSETCPVAGDVASCETFIFGFKGIKGAVTLGTPEPASIALMGTGFVGLAGFARRRASKKA